ncbi:hypothetical protein A2Y85_01945 [candidate division WOR-3 bacterium RBG_13_43_14]|uniref:ABC transporter ATP-binding protein n=1 Tax=candidate division WOR-3 bacterium RBG_13_43_14 TaxID=1802590 RepID=A0A1F4U538_UNCW3|nr:MAG: hypothetical protein A2Y85_01945 [candidate division WOR-3 bacterium RBG_13_43_14]
MNDLYHDEIQVGKVFDWRIFTRLYDFVKPYGHSLLIAFIFLIISAGLEILYPYITKIAIDRYILRSGRLISAEVDAGNRIKINDQQYFVPQQDLEKVDARILRSWEKDSLISAERYYYLFVDSADTKTSAIVDKYEDQTIVSGDLVLIPYGNMNKMLQKDVLVLRRDDSIGLIRLVGLFLIIIIVGLFANYFHIYMSQYAGQMIMHLIRSRVFAKLQLLGLSFFDRNPVGRLVTRATNDVEAINEAFTQVFVRFFKDIFLLIGIIIIMLFINVRLALISFTITPLLLFITFYFRIRARNIYRIVRTKLAKLNAVLQENLSGMRIIKIFRREKEKLRQFDAVNQEYLKANFNQVLLMSFFRPTIEIVSSFGIGLILYFGGIQVITGKISLGVLVAFIAYIEMFFRPIRELTESYTTLQSAMASSERIFLLLDEPVQVKSKEKAIHDITPKGNIIFKNVWFKYDRDWVLKGVSLNVKAGERIAIVGPTGSGKTSIINLLSRLYEFQKGQILIDGIDIQDIDLSTLRRMIGVVPQDVFLFAGDIKSNIRLGLPIDDLEVSEIASRINANAIIERFPKGYDENVAERGVTFSTGERQLLAFARALAFNPKILVLDEATANIDAETEKLIQDGLQKLTEGRTSIIIAHRLSTVKEADRILVVLHGEIVESGRHEELIKARGIYYQLYQMQTFHQ